MKGLKMLESILVPLGFGMVLAFGLFVLPSLRKNMPEAKTVREQKVRNVVLIVVTYVVIVLGGMLVGLRITWLFWIILLIVATCTYLSNRWKKRAQPKTTP